MSIEKNEPPDKSPTYFKSAKVPLKYILKNPDINMPKITTTVIKCNKIIINTLMFMKLYLLDYFEKNDSLPKIDEKFVNACMKTVCHKNSAAGRPPRKVMQLLKDKLATFYEAEYKPLIKDTDLDYTYLSRIFDYLTTDIITMYENNIKLHYVAYVERFVNVTWKKKETIVKINADNTDDMKRRESINEFCKQLRKIKADILETSNEYTSDAIYHNWIKEIKKTITANKNKYPKDSIYYDLHCNPQDYFPCMIRMMKDIGKKGLSIYNVFPMRNDIIAGSIKLDTSTIVKLLFTCNQGKKNDYLFKGNLQKYQNKIWYFFFRTERKCFKKSKYTFHHMIDTDGVSCSILFLRNDLIGKRLPTKTKNTGDEEYIDVLKNHGTGNKKIVAIDPNKSDILYCVDNDNKEANEFRYTQDSRRKECKLKKYAKIIFEYKKQMIDNKTIIAYESELSKLNRKTLVIQDFKEYIKKKSETNSKLYAFYEKYIFRKLRLNGYINRMRHEQKMINNFKKIFGKPDKVIIAIGDWEQKQQMKYKEPTKGIGMRKLFRQNGYKVYLVDEFRTSCMCSKCQNENGKCEKFIIRKNPKPYKTGNILVHGALRCKNCGAVWNRDVNSATNIYRIAKNIIDGLDRPNYLCRQNKLEQ